MAKIKITAERNDLLFCPFPKYKQWPWMDVLKEDMDYMLWLVSERGPEMDETMYDFLMDLLEGA